MLTITAKDRLNNKIGIMNVNANTNLARNVDIVDSQISLVVCLFPDSSDICIPNASEKASAIAMVIMPPRTTNLDPVPDVRPTIKPKVVITPDVRPKLTPFLIESFIEHFSLQCLNSFWRTILN